MSSVRGTQGVNMTRALAVSARKVAAARRVGVVSHRFRIAAVVMLATVTTALAGIGAPSASADTEVWLNNSTSIPFTEGSLCILVGSLSCSLFPEWEKGAVLGAGKSNPGIRLLLQVTGPSAVKFTDTWYPSGTSGYITFSAIDPAIGPTFVECWGNVPGVSCPVADKLYAYLEQDSSSSSELLGSSPGQSGRSSVDARFRAGVAFVGRRGVAAVPIASYSTKRRGAVRERVVLRSSMGRVLGSGEETVRLGAKGNVEVRLTPRTARPIAGGDDVTVRASVTNADGTAGSGQTTSLTLTSTTSALGRLLGH